MSGTQRGKRFQANIAGIARRVGGLERLLGEADQKWRPATSREPRLEQKTRRQSAVTTPVPAPGPAARRSSYGQRYDGEAADGRRTGDEAQARIVDQPKAGVRTSSSPLDSNGHRKRSICRGSVVVFTTEWT